MKEEEIQVLVADPQPLTSAGIQQFLQEKEEIGAVEILDKNERLLDRVTKFSAQLVIADYNVGGVSVEELQAFTAQFPETHILIISSDNDKKRILEVVQLGIKGYLTKECSKEEIMLAIQSTVRGEKFFCHKILDIIMEKSFSNESDCDPTILTVRESEILGLIASGLSTQQVADKLFLSPHTVQTHRKSIIKKLNIKSPTEFVIYAMDLGISLSKKR